MYEFLDRPVTSLDRGGRFLIWSMRSWVAAIAKKQCPADVIAGGFGKWDILSGLHPFLRMMALFNRHGLANFDFCALTCNHVSEHEAIILSLVGTLGNPPAEVARGTLSLLVDEDSIGDVLIALSHLSRAMCVAEIHPEPPARLSNGIT